MRRLDAWILARQPRLGRRARLDQRHLYILPTRWGLLHAAVVLVLFLWSTNYGISLGHGLAYLLVAVGAGTLWRCHANLLGVRVEYLGAEPVLAGQMAQLRFRLQAPRGRRVAIEVGFGGAQARRVDVDGECVVEIGVPTERRGWLRPGPLRLASAYPGGLARAWTWLALDVAALVYPQPRGSQPLPAGARRGDAELSLVGAGDDDYRGLRRYVAGDSPRRVAWKALARGGPLQVKEFSGSAGPGRWLDWDAVHVADTEARLSQLCRWVLQAEARGEAYGLRLPDARIEPGQGPAMRARCLRALALHGLPDEAPGDRG